MAAFVISRVRGQNASVGVGKPALLALLRWVWAAI